MVAKTQAISEIESLSNLYEVESGQIISNLERKDITQKGANRRFRVVDLFSGSGGLSFGFHQLERMFGAFNVHAAVDLDIHANNTYLSNFGLKPAQLNIQELSVDEIRKALDIDSPNDGLIVIGGPPCIAFSSHKKKDKRFDARSSLVEKFAQIATSLNPDVIVMENVPDLMGKRHWEHFENFHEHLLSKNYKVSVGIVNMAEFGVPQSRHRLICIASRTHYPPLPKGHHDSNSFRTVRDAIGHLPPLSAGQGTPDDSMHITSNHRQSTVEVIKQVPLDGGSRPSGVGPNCLDNVKGFSDVYGRLYWDRPSVTLTARCRTPSCGRYIHPEQHRGLSVREAALIHSYPENFLFKGPFDAKYKQIGNSVTPLFSLALSGHILGMMLGLVESDTEESNVPTEPSFGSYSGSIARRGKK